MNKLPHYYYSPDIRGDGLYTVFGSRYINHRLRLRHFRKTYLTQAAAQKEADRLNNRNRNK